MRHQVELMDTLQQYLSPTLALSTVLTLKLKCFCNLGWMLSALSDGQVGDAERGGEKGALWKMPWKQEKQMPGIGVLLC